MWLAALEQGAPPPGLARALGDDPSAEDIWLGVAVLAKSLPTEREVIAGLRRVRREGARKFVDAALAYGRRQGRRRRRVEIARDAVIVDVRHTAETELATGIQRVARETITRWHRDHDIVLTTWTADATALRRLRPDEEATALHGAHPRHASSRDADLRVVVPVGGWFILPELAAESWRTDRIAALARFTSVRTSVIGFDCVPLTSADTVGAGMSAAFMRNLNAVSWMDHVVAISKAAESEYRGWRRMLAARGQSGPAIDSVLLAAEARAPDSAADERFLDLVGPGDAPLVVVVGSHEPRKNHGAVLQAADLLWREGHQFRLLFIGGNSWNSLGFVDRVKRMQADGLPVVALSSVTDEVIWAAYRSARFTMFPSLNEGFGLPIVESVACGTPVITSGFGSMREVGEGIGALFVDPRDDDSVTDGMRRLLSDDAEFERLRAEAAAYRPRSWDDYARDTWALMAAKAGG